MSDNFQQQQYGDRQVRNSSSSQLQENAFHAYQNPGYPGSLHQQQVERPTYIVGRDGLPVQGTGRGDTLVVTSIQQLYPINQMQMRPRYGVVQELQPCNTVAYGAPPESPSYQLPNGAIVSPEILAQEQVNGRVSQDMLQVCNQIWDATHNPADVSFLLNKVNDDFIAMGMPYNFSCDANYPFGYGPGRPIDMSITFNNARTPLAPNKIHLR